MSDELRPSYVAFFDILAFRERVLKLPITEAKKLLIRVRANAEEEAKKHDIGTIQFSDSIILYTKGTEPEKLVLLLQTANKLMGAFMNERIALRGAVATGEFYHDNQTFVGKAMVRAYELEESQEWAGAIVDPDLIDWLKTKHPKTYDEIMEKDLLFEHAAPIKGGSVGELHCLTWPLDAEKRPARELLGVPRQASWDVLRKSANTQDFLDAFGADERRA